MAYTFCTATGCLIDIDFRVLLTRAKLQQPYN